MSRWCWKRESACLVAHSSELKNNRVIFLLEKQVQVYFNPVFQSFNAFDIILCAIILSIDKTKDYKLSTEFTEQDWERMNAFAAERSRWATLSVTINEIVKENKVLVRELFCYDQTVTIPLLAGLLTVPKLQSHCTRLEILVALAVVYCRGRKTPNINDVVSWFALIGQSQCVIGEDPAEDVFVSLVWSRNNRDYRLLDGVWESAGFYTQRVLDVIATMPDVGQFRQIKKSVYALLLISDMVCDKAKLFRYQLGSDEKYSELSPQMIPVRNTLTSRVAFTFAELDNRGITLDDIAPFIFLPQMRAGLPSQQIGHSYLDRYPLIVQGTTHLTVALPSALSVAIRNYVIERIVDGGLIDIFNGVLAQNYSKLLFDTPLLGGPIQAPVIWKKTGDHRWSNFSLKVDVGYFISFHLFLPSVQTHSDGGFKDVYHDDGIITEALQTSIIDVLNHFDGCDDFKEGLVVIVGCGWGKGYASKVIEIAHPSWRLESISVADLVRVSLVRDMTPSYFWRIQDGLEAVEQAGVNINNLNGILNLIGWVRYNNGHIVPHEQLPQGEISPDRPLGLTVATNFLRDVRADSDSSIDRHRAADNIGYWHDVQRVLPNPFFSGESKLRLYASLDDLGNSTLTSLYEGIARLWISVLAPNISGREIVFQLWEMANEWLHRIGNVLDERKDVLNRTHNLKVYVEFLDVDPAQKGGEKPAVDELISLCVVEPHNETNACKAVFKAGFLAGFQIAENVAERLFVRTLAKAYLHLLGVENFDDEAEKIEALVVPNDDARGVHIFYAQQFIDYVKDTLPEKLISIDPIDDAAIKIGLGWRVLEKGQSNKLEGRESCMFFLNKVVDILLTEIADVLKTFGRLSTLKRLVANCEKAYAEEVHWMQTSAAVLGLHGDEPGTENCYVEQLSMFAGADIATRILIEISLCECLSEGRMHVSDIELSKLIARAALVVRIGGLSDAIRYNALVPELTISPLGDILFRNEFGESVVEPMLNQVVGERFIANAPLQKRNYAVPEIVTDVKGKISDEFWDIWNVEMGFDLDSARSIIDILEDKGIKHHTAQYTLKRSEYIALVCSYKVSEDSAIRFLDQFSLVTRPCWNKLPKGFNNKDIYPWRFGRRLSFVTRPILQIDNSADPLLIIAPGALRKGLGYVFEGTYRGVFDQAFFRTKEMRNTWLGKAHEGHTFNTEVAKALSEAGWQVRKNIGLPEIFNRKIELDYGDVDVLAWNLNLYGSYSPPLEA